VDQPEIEPGHAVTGSLLLYTALGKEKGDNNIKQILRKLYARIIVCVFFLGE
jgi:hypothetical protein